MTTGTFEADNIDGPAALNGAAVGAGAADAPASVAHSVFFTREGDRVLVSTPFNRQFVLAARALGGRWNKATKLWSFDALGVEAVHDACREAFGDDGDTVDVCDVRVTFASGKEMQTGVKACGREVVTLESRHLRPELGNGVVLVGGEFVSAGRSTFIRTGDGGAVVVLRRVPRQVAERAVAANTDTVNRFSCAIVVQADTERAALETELKLLEQRAAAIRERLTAI